MENRNRSVWQIMAPMLLTVCACSSDEVCLGIPKACTLTLQEITLVGSHNSGAGFDGILNYHTPLGKLPAISCAYRNQYLSIYDQLKLGVRFLDIDTCYEGRSMYQPNGAWACHGDAMGGPVVKILEQVDKWLNEAENRREIVVIEFNRDVKEKHKEKVGKSLVSLLKKMWEPTEGRRANQSLMMSTSLFQTIGQAVEKNERIFVFIHEEMNLERKESYFFTDKWIGYTWTSMGWFASNQCRNLASAVSGKCIAQAETRGFIRLDLFLTWGLCNDDLASSCNQLAESASKTCHDKIRSVEHVLGKTVNFIMLDYVDNDSGKNAVSVAKNLTKAYLASQK